MPLFLVITEIRRYFLINTIILRNPTMHRLSYLHLFSRKAAGLFSTDYFQPHITYLLFDFLVLFLPFAFAAPTKNILTYFTVYFQQLRVTGWRLLCVGGFLESRNAACVHVGSQVVFGSLFCSVLFCDVRECDRLCSALCVGGSKASALLV